MHEVYLCGFCTSLYRGIPLFPDPGKIYKFLLDLLQDINSGIVMRGKKVLGILLLCTVSNIALFCPGI